MLDALLDALLDSVKVLAVVIVIYVLLSFIEDKIARLFENHKKLSPLYGSLVGLVPQCGVSVVAADLYLNEHITMGTVVAVFIACSDEALPIMLTEPTKIKMLIPFILLKFIIGFVIGFVVDLIFHKEKEVVDHHEDPSGHHSDEIHIGCCGHEVDHTSDNSWKKHLLHPLIHSLKIFAYVLAVNLLFSLLIYYIGEDSLMSFLQQNRYIAPFLASLIGLIPNCASSVIITELFLLDGIGFGACLSGLIVNAGLGLMILLKDKKHWKDTLIIITILLVTANLAGYITCLIIGF